MKKILTVQIVAILVILQLITGPAISADRTKEIGIQAYIYAYPMILMEITRRISTNVEAPKGAFAPMNQFAHLRAFPDHTFREVVRPNADTLYSIVWFDVSKEPVIISVPDTTDRYYMLPMLDMWTDVFAAPGTRTSGSKANNFAIVGPGWEGKLPEDVQQIRSTTNIGWMIGRTQTNGRDDLENVHKIQDNYKLIPLSNWGNTYTPPAKSSVNATIDIKTPPPVQVSNMSAEKYFELFATLLKNNPPHELDWNMIELLKKIGIETGKDLDFSSLPAETQKALEMAVPDAQRMIAEKANRHGEFINGWNISREVVGNYGTSYIQRAMVALVGLGANVPEDAVYPSSSVDNDRQQYNGRNNYLLHFNNDQIPPVNGFWSLAMYNSDGYFIDNTINRYSIGDRDNLKFNSDGSLDIYIQHNSPGKEKESNWLPAPKGDFNLVLRLYWPSNEILTGDWNPPGVKRVN